MHLQLTGRVHLPTSGLKSVGIRPRAPWSRRAGLVAVSYAKPPQQGNPPPGRCSSTAQQCVIVSWDAGTLTSTSSHSQNPGDCHVGATAPRCISFGCHAQGDAPSSPRRLSQTEKCTRSLMKCSSRSGQYGVRTAMCAPHDVIGMTIVATWRHDSCLSMRPLQWS
jgi:hypothetical protein